MTSRTYPPAIQNSSSAILFMMAAGMVNAVMLSAIKQLSGELHPFEIGFFRCLIGFIVLLPIIWRAGGLAVMRTDRIGLHLLRGALNAGAMLAFFMAVSLAPLETVTAISFASPIFATLLAIIILGERVGLHRWSGLIIGFLGAFLIIRPGSSEFTDFGPLLALGSSIGWAGAMIIIKKLTQTEKPLSIISWAALLVGLFSLIPALFVWQWPTKEQWMILVLIGVLGSTIQYCFTKAFSLAETTLVLPFDYLKLIWASLFGFVLFAEAPDPWAWVGGTVIFTSAVYIAYRESLKRTHG